MIISYTFFQNALWAILLICISCAMVGCYVVNRRMVFITGGITHASFGGLGFGFYMGFSPTLGAMIMALLSAVGIDKLSQKGSMRQDSAIAVVWALGMALGVIFIFLTPGYSGELSTFLFGNILTITYADLLYFALFTLILSLFFVIFYRPILYVSFDRDFAKTQGIAVRFIEFSMLIFISICVVLTIRLIGIMLMMSMLTIPQNCAEIFSQKMHNQILLSSVIGIFTGVVGLFVSYLLNVPAAACIVGVMVVVYLIIKLIKRYFLLLPHKSI